MQRNYTSYTITKDVVQMKSETDLVRRCLVVNCTIVIAFSLQFDLQVTGYLLGKCNACVFAWHCSNTSQKLCYRLK